MIAQSKSDSPVPARLLCRQRGVVVRGCLALIGAAALSGCVSDGDAGGDAGGGSAAGEQPAAVGGPPTYATDVAPILKAKCVSCHGRLVAQKGLRLHSLENTLAGGESGPAVVPGNPSASPLYTSLDLPVDDIRHMPPVASGQTISAAEKALLREWIVSGAR